MTTLLDTRRVAPAERPDYWLAGIAEHVFPMRFEHLGDRPFDGRLTGGQVGPITIRSISGVAHSVGRTRRIVAADDPGSILLYLSRAGSCRLQQDDHSRVLAPGDIGIQDSSRPTAFEARDWFDIAVFSVPKWFLGPDADDVARRAAEALSFGRRPIVRAVTPFLAGLTAIDSPLNGADGEGLAEMLRSTVRLLESDRGASRPTAPRTSALLTRMRNYALANLHDPTLGPEHLARAHFVSPRYVHKLFAAAGTGVAEWIREQRMEVARQRLQDSADESIASIANRCGYRDPASFSRAFRQKYGRAPRELRATA